MPLSRILLVVSLLLTALMFCFPSAPGSFRSARARTQERQTDEPLFADSDLADEDPEEMEDEDFEDEDFEDEDFEDEDFEDEDEFAEDGLKELQRQLDEAQRIRARHAQLLKLAERRVKLLTELQKVRTSLMRMEQQFAEVEEGGADIDVDLEELEPEFYAAEMRIERLQLEREVLDRRTGLVELTSEIPQSARELLGEAEKLQAMIGEYEQQTDRLFAALREDRDEEIGRYEESIGRLEADFELKRDILRLKVELWHAQEEGEPEWVEELEAELRELGSLSAALDQPERPEAAEAFEQPVELTPQQLTAAARQPFETKIVPLLKQACGDCHNSDGASGDLNFDLLVQQQPLVVNRDRWKNVIQQLTIRSMPPADADPIPEADRVLLTAWLTQAIDGFDYESIRQPGYEMTRRLTHEEYNNTVRDLLGTDLRPADRFPADMTASSGFENSANSLFMQPVLLERYLGAAESVVDHTLPLSGITDASTAWPALLGNADLSEDRGLRDVLARFLTRAFRRPPEFAEVDRYVQHVQDSRRNGASVHAALRDVIQVVLISPSFLMKAESDLATAGTPGDKPRATTPQQISDWELASRLSYFLWSSMPDERLFDLARRGTLHQPDVLAAQVQRMLQDDRSKTLGTQFAAQWLGFDGMDRLPRSPIDNPWQTDTLIAAMKEESASLFHHLVTEDLPVERLVDADFTFLNQELAQHYGMRGVRGEQLRRVSLKDSPRRGVLGHGSILAVTSFPGRTSPVMRGNWILSQLLGTPPPPPPPNVSELDERVAENERLSARQKLELHRSNPNCYTCHSQIDPLGFALESFEWYGRHRPRRSRDTTGTFPGGASFQGLQGLAQTLVTERIDDLSEQVTRRMLAYALGRQLEYFDEATVRDLLTEFQQEDRRLQTLIQAIVRSDAFQQKQQPTQTLTGKGISHVR